MSSRREFLKNASIAIGAGIALGGCSAGQNSASIFGSGFNMSGFRASKIPKVRIGFIGLGNRGSLAILRLPFVEGAEVTAICDKRQSCIDKSLKALDELGVAKPDVYIGGEDTWKEMCERDDIDLIYITTPWQHHTPMAVYAMEQGKHAAVEVPAATTLDECWQLVKTSEKTQKHCVMLENCCYSFFEMLTLNMARQGMFGEIIHGEGAYIHDLAMKTFEKDTYSDMWRLEHNSKRNGNLYPTHGLGPICQCMDMNRGDKMEYLTAMASDDFVMNSHAIKLAKDDSFYDKYIGRNYRGNINTTMVKTAKGRTIMIQHDVSSPRPYSRIHLLSGTKGIARKFPNEFIAFGHDRLNEEEMKEMNDKYSPEIITRIGETAKEVGGHGGMDFLMDWALINSLRNGLPVDMDCYDAALWSCITPLSIKSIAKRSSSVEVPDFTRGNWKTNKPVALKLEAVTGINKIKKSSVKQMDI